MIYLIQQDTDGPVKIGYTKNRRALEGRLSALRTGHAAELHLRVVIPGEREDEALLHRFFAADRLRGEWFSPGPLLCHMALSERCANDVLDQAQSWYRLQDSGVIAPDGRLTPAGLAYVTALERDVASVHAADLYGFAKECAEYAASAHGVTVSI